MIERSNDWLSEKVGEEIVMMSVQQGRYIALNPIGARIWELLHQPRDRESLHTQLTDEFDVTPEICRSEVDGFLAELRQQGAIIVKDS